MALGQVAMPGKMALLVIFWGCVTAVFFGPVCGLTCWLLQKAWVCCLAETAEHFTQALVAGISFMCIHHLFCLAYCYCWQVM